MKRMKTFLKYLLLLLLLYFISNILIDYMHYRSYSEIESSGSSVQAEGYNINVYSAKATNANGIIAGTISKKDDGQVGNNLMKIDFFNERDQLMGTEYFDIKNLENRTDHGFYYTISICRYKKIYNINSK